MVYIIHELYFYLYAISFIGFLIFPSYFSLCKCRPLVITGLSVLPDENFTVGWTLTIKSNSHTVKTTDFTSHIMVVLLSAL